MKKLLYSAAALALAFFSASCQQENLEPVAGGNTVTYTVQVSDAATKAIGDDISAVNELVYEVYRTEAEEITTFTDVDNLLYHKTAKITNGTATIELEFVNDQNFTVLFWAQTKDNGVYNVENLTNVTITSPDVANNVNAQAFVGRDFVRDCVSDANGKVTLVRPVSQLNIATTPESLVFEANEGERGSTIILNGSSVKVTGLATSYNIATLAPCGEPATEYEYTKTVVPTDPLTVNGVNYTYVAMNYVGFADKEEGALVTVSYKINTTEGDIDNTIENVPVKPNYRTNIVGNLITSKTGYVITLDKTWDAEYNVENGNVTTNTYVTNADEFNAAFEAAFADEEDNNVITLSEDINLNDLLATRSEVADPTYTLKAGKTLTIDLNGKTLSATSAQAGKNYEMFLVKGNLTVMNGTIEYEHLGENMGWGSMTCIFDVTAGGVLNLKDVTAKNLGGSDMGFVAHLNNWGEVTLNVENCTLESNYVPVRVFNSGPDKNKVDIKNSTLTGGNYAFWVHNYTVEDFGSEAKAEAQKALLNLNIYNQGNTFSPDVNGIRYGFTNSVKTDAKGITKVVSEDGTEVTLGSVVENGVIRRGVAGTEENTTITKVVVEEGVAVLYDRTFRRFYALETVELPSTLTTIGAAGSGVFQSCSNLKNVVLPEGLTVLGKGSFQECTSLESINIPAGVTRIESDALRNTGLKSVEFHAGVTYFGAQAFRDCKQLTEVTILAPEFTMEGNTFGIMAAPFTPMTIHVANAEMKAYVESNLTAHAKTYINVKAAEATTTEELNAALKDGAKIVNVAAGEYTFPAGSVKEGTTIVCDEGTVFTGKSSLNVNGATVVGATFKNVGDQAVAGTINGNFKNCTFEGYETLRWCYTTKGTTVVFENCVIKTTLRGIHFDGMDGDVIFKNCEINGFNAYSGAGTITFDGCTFGHDASKYNGLNIYSNTIVKNCVFNYVSGNTNFIDMEGTGKTLTIENCTATLDGAAAEINSFVGGSKLADNTVIIK